jgi:oligopeptide transport system ATP-binding protein
MLEVDELAVHYPVRGGLLSGKRRVLRAVDGISFELEAGETLGVVGESGCGKSTLGRAILRFADTAGGRVRFDGQELGSLSEKQMNALRRDIQIVFQSPLSCLNPRMNVGSIVMEPLEVFEPSLSRGERVERMQQMLARVGLLPEMANRYPNEFSGGQCQRIAIARAMILNPRLLICDEAVSALDVSIKAQIINLLKRLQRDTGVAMVFISHDLAIVRQIAHRILVMYLGKPMEVAPADVLFQAPLHPYTRALLSAVPSPDPAYERTKEVTVLQGDIPSPISPPSGCVFRTRCPVAKPNCIRRVPALEPRGDRHRVACHYA